MWIVFELEYFSRCEILRSKQFLRPMVIILQTAKAEEEEKRRKEYILIRFLYCTISFKRGGGRVETSGRVTIRVTAWCSTMWVVTPCFRKPPGPRKPEWLGPTESWACLTFLYDMWTPSQFLCKNVRSTVESFLCKIVTGFVQLYSHLMLIIACLIWSSSRLDILIPLKLKGGFCDNNFTDMKSNIIVYTHIDIINYKEATYDEALEGKLHT